MGQAVFQHLIAALPPSCPTIDVDSAGTDAYHSLEPPDPRTIETLEAHGIHDFDHAARKVTASDFEKFDFIFAMDRDNLKTLKTRCRRLKLSSEVEQRISLFGDWDPTPATDDAKEIDDPWYGGISGFQTAFDKCVRFSRCWLRDTLNVDVIIDKRSGKVSVTDLNETQSS